MQAHIISPAGHAFLRPREDLGIRTVLHPLLISTWFSLLKTYTFPQGAATFVSKPAIFEGLLTS